MTPPCASRAALPGTPKPTGSKTSEAQNPADRVAGERSHDNHDGLHVVVLLDLRRITPGRLPVTSGVRMRRSDVGAGVCDRAGCRRRRVALSVALQDLHCAAHLAHSERSGPRSQPMTSHANAVTGTTTVDTWSSSSTSVGSPGGPSSSGASQRHRRSSSRSVSASSPSRCTHGCPSGSTLRRPSGALRIDRSPEPSRRNRMRAPSSEPTVDTWSSCSTYALVTRRTDRGSDASQRRRRRISRWISLPSSSWRALGSSPGTAPRRPRGAYRDV